MVVYFLNRQFLNSFFKRPSLLNFEISVKSPSKSLECATYICIFSYFSIVLFSGKNGILTSFIFCIISFQNGVTVKKVFVYIFQIFLRFLTQKCRINFILTLYHLNTFFLCFILNRILSDLFSVFPY